MSTTLLQELATNLTQFQPGSIQSFLMTSAMSQLLMESTSMTQLEHLTQKFKHQLTISTKKSGKESTNCSFSLGLTQLFLPKQTLKITKSRHSLFLEIPWPRPPWLKESHTIQTPMLVHSSQFLNLFKQSLFMVKIPQQQILFRAKSSITLQIQLLISLYLNYLLQLQVTLQFQTYLFMQETKSIRQEPLISSMEDTKFLGRDFMK